VEPVFRFYNIIKSCHHIFVHSIQGRDEVLMSSWSPDECSGTYYTIKIFTTRLTILSQTMRIQMGILTLNLSKIFTEIVQVPLSMSLSPTKVPRSISLKALLRRIHQKILHLGSEIPHTSVSSNMKLESSP